jgi:pyruvate formate lyase activating enzyme
VKAMYICGFEKMSLVDWKGKVAVVLFLGGCNFRCEYCYNKELVYSPQKFENISMDYILNYIKENSDFIDGIVITGGEPTVNPDLIEILQKLKTMNLPIKLDTNGSNPRILRYLIDNNLIDYVAMDVKAPPEKYEQVCGCDIDMDDINNSINLIKSSGMKHEFRTTKIDELTEEDLKQIVSYIGEDIVIQEYRRV